MSSLVNAFVRSRAIRMPHHLAVSQTGRFASNICKSSDARSGIVTDGHHR
jgi:hypothetical protein